MKNKKGFTLVELLAVIVILAIILAIAVPGISGVIQSSTKASFSSDAKLVLKAVDYKKLQDETFDINTIDKTNVTSLLNISAENYSSVDVAEVNGRTYVKLVGQGKWEGLTACGIYKEINIVTDGNCGPDYIAPNITTSPDGTATYIKSSTVTVTVSDETLEANSLGYVWTNSATKPATEEYINSFTNGEAIAMPSDSGIFYLHIIARDTMGNVTQEVKTFKLDNEKPILTLTGDASVSIVTGSIYNDAGATATDNIDTNITSKIIVTGTVNPNVVGTYTLTYNVSDEAGNTATTITRTVTVIQSTYTFSYTGSAQTWTVPATGTYKLEAWGAQGGNSTTANTWGTNTTLTTTGGKGGYASGEMSLTEGQTIYVYVGGQGGNISSIFNYPSASFTGSTAGGWNGGGSGSQSGFSGGGGGGGATDVRIGGTALTNRVIVAGGGGGGGGGGSTNPNYGGNGGASGVNGSMGYVNASYGSAGAPGTASALSSSIGGNAAAVSSSNGAGGGGGGGGGYYAGTGAAASSGYSPVSSCNGSCSGGGSGGGGGSSHTYSLTNAITKLGNVSFTSPTGTAETGHAGSGYAKLTYISQ